MYRKYHGFLHFFFQVSKQTNQKHWYLQCFDKTACKKTQCFRAIFHTFSAHAPPFKMLIFSLVLPPLIRTQEGVKSGQIAKLHLNSTFCLSQSLPQSCNTKNWVSCLPKCCKLRCFMNVPCILPAKKVPPPAKADCLSAPGKTRPFAPTVRADLCIMYRNNYTMSHWRTQWIDLPFRSPAREVQRCESDRASRCCST